MKISLVFMSAFAALFLFSCEPDDTDNDDSVVDVDYTPMSVGNYWVYKNYIIDSLGNETLQDHIDSVWISRTVELNGHTYYEFACDSSSSLSVKLLSGLKRDSAGYLISDSGRKLFSDTDFDNYLWTDTLAGGSYSQTAQMDKVDHSLQIEGHTYNDALKVVFELTNHNVPLNDRNPMYGHDTYAPNVGIVLYKWSFSSDYYLNKRYYERRLVRYHIND